MPLLLAQGLRVTGVQENQPGQILIEFQSDTPGRFRLLRGSTVTRIETPVATNDAPASSGRFVHSIASAVAGVSGPVAAPAFFRIERLGPDPGNVPPTVFTSSPAHGEVDVSVTRETILRFSNPLGMNSVIDQNILFASFGGRNLLSRVEVSADRRTATLFYLEPVPASARIRVTFFGDSVLDYLGRPVDGDGDGTPGGIREIDYDTLSITPVGQTAITGRVFASELIPDPTGARGTVNKPLPGVTITVDGAEETLRAVTDSEGNFRLQPSPAGKFFVHIDGRTSPLSRYPNGDYYPVVGKQWEAAAGRTNNLAGGTGEIFLPLITEGTLQRVSATEATVITFPPAVVASNAALSGVSITVPPNALFSDNGARGGRVGIAPVSPDRLPEPLPPGLEFPLVITVQTDGALNFDQPVPVCFPNLPDPGTGAPLSPGEENFLYSFNHDTGEWESIGSMTVSSDGKYICSDAGVGILQPGWHGSGPWPTEPPKCPPNGLVRSVCCLSPATPGPPPPPPGLLPGLAGPSGIRGIALSGLRMDSKRTELHERINCPPCTPDTSAYSACVRRAYSNYAARNIGCMTLAYKCLATVEAPPIAVGCALAVIACKAAAAYQLNSDLDTCQKAYNCRKASHADFAKAIQTPDELDNHSFDQVRSRIESAFEILQSRLYVLPLSESDRQRIDQLVAEVNSLAGGDVEAFLRDYQFRSEQEGAAPPDSYLDMGNAPPYAVRYVARIKRNNDHLYLRSSTEAFGNYSLFVPRDAEIEWISFYDHRTQSYARIHPNLLSVRNNLLPRFNLYTMDSSFVDLDVDGLPDLAEEVLGTDPRNPDTDSDGIPDGAEIDNGTNPLDGLAVSTGIIASADTPGIPVDISVIDDIAIVANSAAGITVFNVRAGLNPLRIAQLDTPGTALAVSSSGGLIAVADGSEGLQIVDFSDPPSARIVRQVPVNSLGGGSAQCVATAANLAFVGTTQGSVSMVGLDTGIVFQRLDLGGSIHDLAIEGTTLYAYAEGKLHVLPFALGPMQLAGSVNSPGTTEIGRPRLFVGNGIAYTVQAQGYNTFSVADPAKPVLLASGSTTQFGWKQIVLNGSGLGVAANAPTSRPDSRHNVFLYDTSDPTRNDVFLTQFETPGVARAISLYNGLAYVADSASPGFIAEASSRMHVVNYLAYDNRKQPPTGTITTSSTNGTVTGGGFVVLRAEVRDDVQVRNVEFFVEGQRIAIDGNFPFEVVYRVPTNSTGRDLNVWARLYDTGGNTTSVTNATLAVVPDNQPPGISIDSPSDNQIFFIGDEVPIRVTAIDNSGIDSVTFTLNGIPVPVRRLSFYEWRLDMKEPPTGTNVLVATATDLAGLKGTSRPLRFVVLKEAVSREVSVFNLEAGTLVEAISREVSTFNFGADSRMEAISREVSTFNGGVDDVDEAISREVSTFNFGPADKPEAISREVSIENPNPSSAAAALKVGSAPKGEVQ